MPGDGDCFFNSLLLMAGDYLRAMGTQFGWGDREPSVREMRDAIGDALERSYRAYWADPGAAQREGLYASLFPGLTGSGAAGPQEREVLLADHAGWIRQPGNWERDLGAGMNSGDIMVNIAAGLWQLPLTALGPDGPVDFGPASGGVERGYLLYDGAHYTGLARDPVNPARPAAELLPAPAPPAFEIPGDIAALQLAAEFGLAFDQLHTQAAQAVGAAADPQGRLLTRLLALRTDFEDIRAAASAARDEDVLVSQIRRMSDSYQNLAVLLRQAQEPQASSSPTEPGT